MDTADVLRRTIDRAEKRLAQLEAVPDPALMPVETVVFWKQNVKTRSATDPRGQIDRAYMYVALKVPLSIFGATADGAVWYVTGMNGRERYTDDELREVLAHENTSDRYVVSEWLPLAEYVPVSPFESNDDA